MAEHRSRYLGDRIKLHEDMSTQLYVDLSGRLKYRSFVLESHEDPCYISGISDAEDTSFGVWAIFSFEIIIG